ncbi:MAG: DNA topoisomerase 3 [bacterium]
MSKSLIIAEKPSVAADLAKALAKMPSMPPFTKDEDSFENDRYVITSAIGHLVQLRMPMGANGKKLAWGFGPLPILPERFDLEPIPKTEKRYRAVVRMIKRKDVSELINACDAGREGELIFRYILDCAGVNKPVRRLWMQSMTQGAILEAFERLRTGDEMQSLSDVAKSRSESDWLIGLNGTRALTALNSQHGGFLITPVGRVQTPTLTILAHREREIAAFVPRAYFEVMATFEVGSGTYEGRWFDESFQKDELDDQKRAERLWDEARATAIAERCANRPGRIEQTTKPTKQAPPLLYDLTSLQREASNRFGFSARRTLQLAQALYDRYKVLTYPRTDSRYLPKDYVSTVKETLAGFAKLEGRGGFPTGVAEHAGRALAEGWVKPLPRVFDDKKVSDHFAIIPTGTPPPANLPEAEQKLFDMVLRRFVAVFFPSAEFEVTTRITRVGEDAFRSNGKILKEAGWLAVYGKAAAAEEASDEDDDKLLAAAADGDSAETVLTEVHELITKPPARYTEATLLSAMENAGKLVDDEALAEAMKERGLGTPATRAAIIEGLIYDKYIDRDRRELRVTAKGLALTDQIVALGIEALGSPDMTGEWEHKLRMMERHELGREQFMDEIRGLTRDIVQAARKGFEDEKKRTFPDLTNVTCGVCGSTEGFTQKSTFYGCKNPACKLKVNKIVASYVLSDDEVRTLIEKQELGPIDRFRSKKGVPFTASLRITDGRKATFVFPDGTTPGAVDWPTMPVIAPCPVCKEKGRDGMIHDTPFGYLCSAGQEDRGGCTASLPKRLCQKELTPENAREFFQDGRTTLIEGMISKRGRPFSAFLVCTPAEKRLLQWEFPPRAPKGGKGGKGGGKKGKKAKAGTEE